MTAVSVKRGSASARRNRLVLPLPRNPVSTVVGSTVVGSTLSAGLFTGLIRSTGGIVPRWLCNSKPQRRGNHRHRLLYRNLIRIMPAITQADMPDREEIASWLLQPLLHPRTQAT